MGSQSSKAPRGDVTAEEAAGASPAKANGQENGHVKSNGDLSPKGEGESPPVNGTEDTAGATGDAIEPAPASQGAEAKGDAAPKETPKKKKKFSFKKPFKLSGLSFKRNRKEGGGIPRPPRPPGRSRGRGRWVPAARKVLPRKGGRLLPPLSARNPRPRGQAETPRRGAVLPLGA